MNSNFWANRIVHIAIASITIVLVVTVVIPLIQETVEYQNLSNESLSLRNAVIRIADAATGEDVDLPGDLTVPDDFYISSLTNGSIPIIGTSGILTESLNLTYTNTVNGLSVQVSGSNITRSATVIVASANASTQIKTQSDYICDNTGDQVEINAAISSLTSGRGWKETVKCIGGFTLSGSINQDSYTLLDLTEAQITVTTTDPAISAVSKTNFDIVGGNFNGNNLPSSVGIYIESCVRPTITYTKVHNFASRGIQIESLTAATDDGAFLAFNHVYDCAGTGIALGPDGGNAEYCTLVANECSSCATGIEIESNNNDLIGNHCGNNVYYGIYIHGSRNTVTGGSCNHNSDAGLIISGTVANVKVNGVTITQNGKEGLSIGASVSGLTVTNNVIYTNAISDPGGSNDTEIRITRGASADFVIANNIIGDSGNADPSYTIYATDGALTRCRVHDNILENGGAGIFYTTTGLTIYDNNGFITENNGTSTIASGGNVTAVAHGLGITPDISKINLTALEIPTNAPQVLGVSDNATSVYFWVFCDSDPGATNFDFAWNYKN